MPNFTLTGVRSLPILPEKAAPIPPNFRQTNQNQALIPAERMVKTPDGRIFLVSGPQEPESLFCPPN
jgi:hypothetical protein